MQVNKITRLESFLLSPFHISEILTFLEQHFQLFCQFLNISQIYYYYGILILATFVYLMLYSTVQEAWQVTGKLENFSNCQQDNSCKEKLINLKFTTCLTFENERMLWKVKLVKF